MPLDPQTKEELRYLQAMEQERHALIKILLPCGCRQPLLGYRNGVGPRCRLCNRTFRVTEVK
jgi:hypothetical protein